MQIVNVEPDGFAADARALLEGVGHVVECRPRTRGELLAAVAAANVLITRLGHRIDSELLDHARHLAAVVSATTGLDHIDLTAARDRGVAVLSLKGEFEFLDSVHATAEHAWGLLLATVRRLPSAHASVLSGTWDRDAFKGRELRDKRLGILGLGRLGRKVAKYGLAFEMAVSAYDPHAATWIDGVSRCDALEDLLRASDILTLHASHDPLTHRMIGARELGLLPSGAVVINTARGGLVDEQALAAALSSGQVGAAGLDVLEQTDRGETELRPSALLSQARASDNLIITPHIGGATFESMASTEVFMAKKLIAFIGSREPQEHV